jgi:hypothetical protein
LNAPDGKTLGIVRLARTANLEVKTDNVSGDAILGPGYEYEPIENYPHFISALLFMAAPAILSGWALYGVAAAGFGVFLPIAMAMSKGVSI